MLGSSPVYDLFYGSPCLGAGTALTRDRCDIVESPAYTVEHCRSYIQPKHAKH